MLTLKGSLHLTSHSKLYDFHSWIYCQGQQGLGFRWSPRSVGYNALLPMLSPACKALLSFPWCTQRAPYNHKSSSSQVRNFSDLECSIAVLSAKGNTIHTQNKGPPLMDPLFEECPPHKAFTQHKNCTVSQKGEH